MSEAGAGDLSWRIDVTADKPGRHVLVRIERGGLREGVKVRDHGPWEVSLWIEPGGVAADYWTWLSGGEARLVAAALVVAAEEAERRNGEDPRRAP